MILKIPYRTHSGIVFDKYGKKNYWKKERSPIRRCLIQIQRQKMVKHCEVRCQYFPNVTVVIPFEQ